MKEYRENNRAKFNASRYIHRDKVKYAAFLRYAIAGKIQCALCTQADFHVLVLDHINDDGAQKRKDMGMATRGNTSGGGAYFILRKMGYPPGLQILCANCNMKKEAERHIAKRMENKFYLEAVRNG